MKCKWCHREHNNHYHNRLYEKFRKGFKMQLYSDRMKQREYSQVELKAWAEIKRVLNGKNN